MRGDRSRSSTSPTSNAELLVAIMAGHTYRSRVSSMGAEFMLPVSAENRAAAGVAAGDEVDVDIELDIEPRDVSVPPDLPRALDGDPDARQTFGDLSYSNKRRYVIPIEDAKSAPTRQRRIAKAVSDLRAGRAQR